MQMGVMRRSPSGRYKLEVLHLQSVSFRASSTQRDARIRVEQWVLPQSLVQRVGHIEEITPPRAHSTPPHLYNTVNIDSTLKTVPTVDYPLRP